MKNNENSNDNSKFKYIVYIQFEESKKAYTFGSDVPYNEKDKVVVETVRGKELGTVCSPSIPYDESKAKGSLKPVLRLATEYDLIQKEENEEKAKSAMKICHQCIEDLNLDMHLISSEYTLDRSKVIFTYVSDDRVDFRQLLKDLAAQLSEGRLPSYDRDDPRTVELVRSFGLLTILPAFICANTDEKTFRDFGSSDAARRLEEYAAGHGLEVVPVCAKLEEELGQLEPEEAALFMADLGVAEPGLNRVIRTGYRLLDYLTFFTAGPMEARAWTVTRGTPAPQAAGKIHTDLCRGFIRMETVSYEDMVACGGWNKAKEAGKLRIEGKDYLIQDGDVIHVRFSV